MPTSGDELLERIVIAYEYLYPQRGLCTSHATALYAPPVAPSLDRLPAFIIQVDNLDKLLEKSLEQTLTADIATNALNLEAAQASCQTQLSLKIAKEDFADKVLRTEGDVTSVANDIANSAKFFIKQAYSRQRRVDIQAQYPLADQTPDRLVSLGDSGFVGEDKSWLAFEHGARQIIDIAQSEAGRQLKRWAKEEHGRAMLYKLAVAMFDTERYWGFLFGGDGALFFQRCQSEEPTRYGLLCSGLLTIDRLFVTTLGMLLVPGDTPLVHLANYTIPVPAACPPRDNQILTRANQILTRANQKTLDSIIEDNQDMVLAQEQDVTVICGANTLHVWFSMPGYEFMTLQLSRSTAMHSSPSSSPPDSPPLLTPPHKDTPLAFIHKGLENHFTQEVALPLSRQLPLVATPPVLVNERMGPGATGVVFAGHIHSFPVIIKTIPPEFGGEADLRHEHHVYSLLASLQGCVIPQMYGLFEGEGWTALMIEHCGDKVSDVHQLSLQQRETLGQHAHEIHANGIRHTDLELRNLIVSTSGDLRIVDFAYSEVGHECEGGMCRELSYFRTLLKLP